MKPYFQLKQRQTHQISLLYQSHTYDTQPMESLHLPVSPMKKTNISFLLCCTLFVGIIFVFLLLLFFFTFLFHPAPSSVLVASHKGQIIDFSFVTPVSVPGANGNPWNYTFNPGGGGLIYHPTTSFCGKYFSCTGSFWSGIGYVVECADGLYSHTGGLPDACMGDGRVINILYRH